MGAHPFGKKKGINMRKGIGVRSRRRRLQGRYSKGMECQKGRTWCADLSRNKPEGVAGRADGKSTHLTSQKKKARPGSTREIVVAQNSSEKTKAGNASPTTLGWA